MTTFEKRWIAHYDRGVARTIGTYPDRTMLDFLADAAREAPGGPALWFKGTTVTWKALHDAAQAAACAYAAMGIGRGDRVALVLPNCPQFLIAELGAWMVGAVVCPLNPIYTEEELGDRIRSLAPRVVITLNPFYDRVANARAGSTVERVIATNIKEYFPAPLRLAFTLLMERRLGHRATLRAGDLEWGAWLAPHRGWRSTATPAGPEDEALILLSGGTTGTPKGVQVWHRGMVYTGRQFVEWLGDGLRNATGGIMLPLPLFHSYGALVAQPLALMGRLRLTLVPNPRDLDDLVKTFQRVRPNMFAGVPTLYNALLNHRLVKAGKVDFTCLTVAASGAAPLMAETKRRFEEMAQVSIVEAYSLTEALVAGVANPMNGERKPGSVGIPLPDVTMAIVDVDDAARELPGGEVGEILLHGPQIMRSYFNDPAETENILVARADGRTWLRTGDLGYIDDDGYLFIVDRKKDLIKASGMQVWPRELEEVLAKHPAVAEVGVRGFADAAKGEIAVAFVVLRQGLEATEQELREYCKQHLAFFKVPSRVVFRHELPKSMIGKVLRRMLTLDDPGAPA
jgi:long-chain acyl-CoA synthetase